MTTHNPIIDYISFSIPVPKLLDQYDLHIKEGYKYEPERRIKRVVNFLKSLEAPEAYGGKGVFDRMLHFQQSGVTYFDGNKSGVSLLQISGEGCKLLREEGRLDAVLQDWTDRLTRLDIAVDIETDTHPQDFYKARSNQRFKSDGHKRSPTGDTWYVGGQKSDRHARIYRYNPPHPRCDYLRVEYELHDHVAKHTAESILELGTTEVGWALGTTFGWTHPCYNPTSDAPKMSSAPRPASFGKTEFWLHKAVKPAIEKMARSGKLQFLIEFESWLHAIIEEYSIYSEDKAHGMAKTNWTSDGT